MKTCTIPRARYCYALKATLQGVSALGSIRTIIAGILLLGYPSITQAYVNLRIEWLDAWNVSAATDGEGNYQSQTNVTMDPGGNVPIIEAQTWAQDEDSSAAAEVRVSRQFRVVLDDAPAVAVRLQGDVGGRLNIDNTWGGDNGEVRFRAKAGIEGTALQYDRQWERKDKDGSVYFDDSIAVDGALAANQTHTVTGYAYALGDSDLGHTGHEYRANGTLSLPDPIAITDPIDDYYYDVEWQKDWLWSSNGNADGIGTLDIFSDITGQIIGGFWGSVVNQGLDAYFEASSSAEKVEGHFLPDVGESYVYARGRFGGHAWINVTSERDFSLVPDVDALAQLRFDGSLTGNLSSSGTSSAMSLAEISVLGSGLEWTMGQTVSDGETATIDEDILAFGMAQLGQTYTFEGFLSTDSQSLAPGSLAYADFLSSLEGELTVEAVPLPGSTVLAAIGMAYVGGILRRRMYKPPRTTP